MDTIRSHYIELKFFLGRGKAGDLIALIVIFAFSCLFEYIVLKGVIPLGIFSLPIIPNVMTGGLWSGENPYVNNPPLWITASSRAFPTPLHFGCSPLTFSVLLTGYTSWRIFGAVRSGTRSVEVATMPEQFPRPGALLLLALLTSVISVGAWLVGEMLLFLNGKTDPFMSLHVYALDPAYAEAPAGITLRWGIVLAGLLLHMVLLLLACSCQLMLTGLGWRTLSSAGIVGAALTLRAALWSYIHAFPVRRAFGGECDPTDFLSEEIAYILGFHIVELAIYLLITHWLLQKLVHAPCKIRA